MLLTALHFFLRFIMADLAHRRKLEGQICADTVRYHIAADWRWRQDQKTSMQSARLRGQMAHHLLSHLREADVRGGRPPLFGESGRRLVEPNGPGQSLRRHPTPSALSPDWFPRSQLSCTTPLDTAAGIWCTRRSNTSGDAALNIIVTWRFSQRRLLLIGLILCKSWRTNHSSTQLIRHLLRIYPY